MRTRGSSVAVFCGIDWAEDHHDIALVDHDGTLAGQTPDRRRRGRVRRAAAAAGRGRRQRRTSRSRWRSRPAAACWWPACAPPDARCSRSTRCRCRATATGTRSRGTSPTPATRSCWPTSCAPTWPRTDRCPPTPNWPRRSRCSPAPNRTRSGRAPTRTTSCARCCASSTPPSSQAFASKRGGLLRPEARALLAAAPTPRAAARLTLTQLRALLRRAGLQRGLDAEADRLQADAARRLPAPPRAGRGGLRAAGPGPAAPARHRLRQRRRARRRDRRTLRPASGRGDHHQPARPRSADRRPGPGRDRRRPRPLRRRPRRSRPTPAAPR